jgi:drug efflux transport system ATP-binding protein
MINIENLTKKFNSKPALDNLNMVIPKGKITGLVGPDGAGKTTLIRLMAALMLPTSGTIQINGFDTVKNQSGIHQILGYMPQKFGLYEDLTVQQNLNLYASLRGVESSSAIFADLLKFTNLAPFTGRLAGRLSGGMKQKLGLACSLMGKPQLLLLDEPSVGVDPISRRELWNMVFRLLEEGVTVIWSTAYLDEAEKCDQVLLLNEGKVLYQGSPADLTRRVEGRVFRLTHIEEKRHVLTEALKNDAVIDGVIQGADVRLVFKDPSRTLPLPAGAKMEPATPRFEDAFIDILGGGPKGESPIAALTPSLHAKEEPAVEANHLTKKFGDFTAARDITFKIKRGEIFGLLGPNGAGKTTTFKMMCGLLTPTEGTSFVNGVNLQTAAGIARSHIGYMAQKFSLYGTLSTLQNLKFFSGVYNLTGENRQKQIRNALDVFSLQPYSNTSADLLPLGFKQRLALSCALMHHPDVLFLDEPTSGVDPITRREFWQHINALVDKGVTVIVTTHFMDEAEYCDRIGLVYRSQMIQMGTPDDLKERAKTKENETPTLEDAFIHAIESFDKENGHV